MYRTINDNYANATRAVYPVSVTALTIGEKNYKSKRGIITVTSLVQNLEEDLGRCKSVAQMSSPPILSECVSHRRATTWCMRARVLEAATVAADTVALAAARPAASRRFAAAAARARDVEGEQRCDGVVGGRERVGEPLLRRVRGPTEGRAGCPYLVSWPVGARTTHLLPPYLSACLAASLPTRASRSLCLFASTASEIQCDSNVVNDIILFHIE